MCAMPFDPSAHRRCAETLYSMGGERNLRDAKNHFAAALDFTNGRDVRAMYGVVLCAKKLREYAEGGRAEGRELAAAAAERLLQRYVGKIDLYSASRDRSSRGRRREVDERARVGVVYSKVIRVYPNVINQSSSRHLTFTSARRATCFSRATRPPG